MSKYKPLEVELLEFAGLIPALYAMRLPKKSESDSTVFESPVTATDDRCGWVVTTGFALDLGPKDKDLARRLIKGGDEHAKAIRGIETWIRIKMQVGFMIEWDTYRIGCECLSSTSTMHGELKGISGQELAEAKQDGLSEKVYERIFKINYQVYRRIYKQRRHHRHPDWQIFCDFIETLPFFDVFIMPE